MPDPRWLTPDDAAAYTGRRDQERLANSAIARLQLVPETKAKN